MQAVAPLHGKFQAVAIAKGNIYIYIAILKAQDLNCKQNLFGSHIPHLVEESGSLELESVGECNLMHRSQLPDTTHLAREWLTC